MEKKKNILSLIWSSATVSIIITLILFVIASWTSNVITKIGMNITPNTDAWAVALSYGNFLGIWIVFILAMLISRKTRPFLKKLGPDSGNTCKNMLLGAVLGFVTNSICVLAAVIFKKIHISPSNSTTISELLIIFLCVIIQSGAEELLCRLYLYQRIKLRYPSGIPSAIVTALLFSLLHILNNGITPLALLSITVIGMLYAAIIFYFDAFWMCAFAHTLWNYTQDIIYGLPNSGMVSQYSIFKLDASADVNSFVYHNEFGVESTWLAIIVNLIAFAVVVYLGRKKKQKESFSGDAVKEETPVAT